jgi:pyridoxal phosphate enzyme (YggS family)
MLIRPQNLAANLQAVRLRIAAAARQAGRSEQCITLLAVSKGQPVAAVEAAALLGQRDFGENYLQEALPKIAALQGRGLGWHFIGPLQSNKTRMVAEHFDWVHAVGEARHAERLAAQRPAQAAPLNVCLQVKLGDEMSKSGVAAGEVAALARVVANLPRLQLRGLMCLPPAETDPARQRHWFGQLRELAASLRAEFPSLDTLSMGMSADLEAAVAQGATIVRVGTAIFGPRDT